MFSSESTDHIRVPWKRIVDWATEHHKRELETGQPAKLTDEQLKAISYLVPFNDEPVVDDTNYISRLMGAFWPALIR